MSKKYIKFADVFVNYWRRMKNKPMADGPSEVSYAPLSPKDAAMEFHWERHKECDGVITYARTIVCEREVLFGNKFQCKVCGCMIQVTIQGIIEVYADDDQKA